VGAVLGALLLVCATALFVVWRKRTTTRPLDVVHETTKAEGSTLPKDVSAGLHDVELSGRLQYPSEEVLEGGRLGSGI